MTTGGRPFPLWDSRNEDQQAFVSLTSCNRLLNETNVTLRQNLRFTQVLPHLRQLGVLSSEKEAEITLNATEHVMVDRLIRHLKRSSMWCFHALLRACALTGQTELIRVLQLNPADYIQDGDQAVPVGQQLTEQAQLLRALKDHNQGMKQTMMRRNLYDFGNSSSARVLDTSTSHIEVDTDEEKDGGMKDVNESHILQAFPGEEGPPRVIRIYGQPGVGKSALTRHIGYISSVEFLERLEASGHVTGGKLTTMVYIEAKSITGTVEDAIMDNLRCRPEDKKILYNYVMAGNGSVIGLDAIDEVRNPEVMEKVKQYVSDRQRCGQGPCIIVTSRTDLCPIETQAFDRFLVAKGFTESQAIAYITAYLTGETRTKVLDYTRTHREKLYPVITNPLRCHIFCALVSEGELELDENDDFCIMKLFTLLEKCLLKRERKTVTTEESKRFYAMCMDGLMHGLREFSQDHLDKFQIAKSFLIFLTKKETTSLQDEQVTYTFPHEVLYEVFAGRCMESLSSEAKKSLLLSICSKPALRNLQKIIFEVIMLQGPNNQELLQTMARAILILQNDCKPRGFFQSFTLHGKLVNLHRQIRPPETLDMSSLEHKSKKHAKDINKIWRTISDVFDDTSDALKEVKWYRGLGQGVFGHVTECLQVLPVAQREELTKTTINKLLPCEFRNKKGCRRVIAVGESRWAEVVINHTKMEVHIHAWSPADMAEALHEYTESETAVQQAAGYYTSLHINTDQTVWGQPALSAFTPDVWKQLVVEVRDWRRRTGGYTPRFMLGRSTPLPGLLHALCEVEYLYDVHGGTAGMQDVYSLLHTGKLLYVELHTPTLVVPAGVEPAVLRDTRDKLLAAREIFGGNVVKAPNFVTETGVKYVW